MPRQFAPTALKSISTPASQVISQYSPSALRTSAAFFHSLTTNLYLADAFDHELTSSSPLGTPLLLPRDHAIPTAPSYVPLPHPALLHGLKRSPDHYYRSQRGEATSSPSDGPAYLLGNDSPELITFFAETDEDRAAGLALVADSVVQQRHFASRVLVLHPLNLTVLTAFLVATSQWLYTDRHDVVRFLSAAAGVTTAYLLAVRLFTQRRYTALARDIDWDWLGDDRLILTRFGDNVIGALVLGWVVADGKAGRRRRKGKGLVRAWTVRTKYRRKGVGTGLLEEAVRAINEAGGDGVDFAEEHANSKRILKDFFNRPFVREELRAQQSLEDAVQQHGGWIRRGSR